jgi:hypothetical protein
MGWITDIFLCAFVGFVCAIIAHFIFKIPTDNLRWIFFLGFFGWLILDTFIKTAESGGNTLLIIIGVLVGIAIAIFFIWPMISAENSDGMDDTPSSISPITTVNSSTISTKPTTVTQIEYITRNFKWKYGGEGYSFTIHIPESLYEYYREQPHD